MSCACFSVDLCTDRPTDWESGTSHHITRNGTSTVVKKTMYINVSFDGVPDAELKRPKLKADEDVLEEAREEEGDQPLSCEEGGTSRRVLYLLALCVFAFLLFTVPPDWQPSVQQQRQLVGNTTSGTPTMIDYARLRAETPVKKPFTHVVCKNAIAMPTLRDINVDFPPSLTTKAHVEEEDLVAAGEIKGKFAELLDELRGAELRRTLEVGSGERGAGKGGGKVVVNIYIHFIPCLDALSNFKGGMKK